MEKNNNLIAAQVFIMLCAFALPFISLYCQEAPRQIRRVSRAQRPKPTAPRTFSRKRTVSTSPTLTTTEPETEDAVEPTQETPSVEDKETIDTATPEIPTPGPDAQQTQAVTATASTWGGWYTALAPLVLASIYKASTTGIKQLTDAVVKLFIARRDVLAKREELEKEKAQLDSLNASLAYLSTEEGRKKLQALPEQDQEMYKTIPKYISKMATALSSKEDKLVKVEKQTSIPAIVGTGAYIGLINTAVLVMGTLMGSVIGNALQMLMPVEKS